jgi:hypothetical protein
MSLRFAKKYISAWNKKSVPMTEDVKAAEKEAVAKASNKGKKNVEKMTNEQISAAEAVANDLNAIKVVKKDRGLIERTESSKIVLTEDNRQVLTD